MPRRGGRKKETEHLVYGDTPEIEALSTGFARKGYYDSGYEKARVFANVTTSSYLAAKIKPDGTHAPARFAYATGIYEPDKGGIFAVGKSAKELAAELNFKTPRALQTAFEKNILTPDPSMPGTDRALVNGKPVFKFREAAAVNAALARSSLAAPAARALARSSLAAPAAKALASAALAGSVGASPVAAALAAYQTRSVAHRARMAERVEDLVAHRAASPVARITTSPARLSLATPSYVNHGIREYTRGLRNVNAVLDGLEREIDTPTRVRARASAGVTVKEFDAPVIQSPSRWV